MSHDQLDLLGGLAAGREARDVGMARAAGAADDDWKEWAQRAMAHLAAMRRPFTADDLEALRVASAAPEPGSRNAVGALFNTARRRGLIYDTGRTVQTTAAQGHARRLPVWCGTPQGGPL